MMINYWQCPYDMNTDVLGLNPFRIAIRMWLTKDEFYFVENIFQKKLWKIKPSLDGLGQEKLSRINNKKIKRLSSVSRSSTWPETEQLDKLTKREFLKTLEFFS